MTIDELSKILETYSQSLSAINSQHIFAHDFAVEFLYQTLKSIQNEKNACHFDYAESHLDSYARAFRTFLKFYDLHSKLSSDFSECKSEISLLESLFNRLK